MNRQKNNDDIRPDQKKRESLMIQPDILSYRDEITILEKEELQKDLAVANLEYEDRKTKRLVQEPFLADSYSFVEKISDFSLKNSRNRQKKSFSILQQELLPVLSAGLKEIFKAESFCFYIRDDQEKQHFNLIKNLKREEFNLKEIDKLHKEINAEYLALNRNQHMFTFNLKPKLDRNFLIIPLQSRGFRSINGLLIVKINQEELNDYYLEQAGFLREELHSVYFDVFRHLK